MKTLKPKEHGFITMIVMLILILVAALFFVYLRVSKANG